MKNFCLLRFLGNEQAITIIKPGNIKYQTKNNGPVTNNENINIDGSK